tara:strand:+ start:1368 stop:1823 length:456 start_codon:yes stop_codon:yes gene_type:complete
MKWYLIKTKNKQTIKAFDYFNIIGVKCYIPHQITIEKRRKKLIPLLNGYVFISFNDKIDYDLVNLNPYSTNVITKNGKPILIPEEQMRLMINHLESRYNSNDFKSHTVGDLIEINSGSLNGLSGQIIEIRNNKIYLQIESLSAKIEVKYSN